MASKGSRRRRGGDSREKYREAFFDQAGAQILELSSLVAASDEETDTSVAAELERLADTAGTLGLGQLERAARSAARDLPLGRRLDALRLVAQALRRTRGARRLGPILVVAGAASAAGVTADAEVCGEPIRLFPTMQAFTDALHVDEPTAVCLPVEAHDAVRQLAEYESFPVIVHGPPGDVEGLALAMTHGASGFIDRPIDLEALTHLARWRSTAHLDLVEVFLLMDAGPAREQLKLAIEAVGMRVTVSGAPSELGPALDQGLPEAVVFGAEVHGVPSGTLASWVRGHGRCGHIPLMIIGKPKSAARIREAGVDDLMRDNAEPNAVAQRIRERVQRFRSLPFPRLLSAGLENRLGLLQALDGELRRARRERHLVTVAMLQIDGLGREPGDHAPASAKLRRAVAASVAACLRRTDIAGELLPGAYLFVLPHASRPQAEPRVNDLCAHLQRLCAADPALQALTQRVGLADTEVGLLGVAARAERDLS